MASVRRSAKSGKFVIYGRGITSAINPSGTTVRVFPVSKSPRRDDADAIHNDWVAVGEDLHESFRRAQN